MFVWIKGNMSGMSMARFLQLECISVLFSVFEGVCVYESETVCARVKGVKNFPS